MVKEKMRCSVSSIVEGGHSFCPFCDVIDCDNNVFVAIARGGITSHEVNAPFTKRVGSNDWVKKRRWCSCFVGIKMTFITSLHGMNAIVKQCGPKISCSDDFLSSGHPRKMSLACAAMAVVQDSIGLVNGQASMSNGVDSSLV